MRWLSFTVCLLGVGRVGRGEASEALRRFEYAQLHMGVRTRLVVYAPDEPVASQACAAAFRRIAELEDLLSDYRPTSELMRLCARAGGPPIRVSSELFFLLQRAQDLSRRSGGAFDVTVGPYVALWREARKTGEFPSAEKLRQARRTVGWRKVQLDPKARTVRLQVSGMRLDLGGIAKGYAGDQALAVLKQHGLHRALFEAGGEIVVSGPPPDRPGWRVELPIPSPGGKSRVLTLAHAALSTSGDTEQFVEFDGRRYSHIVDPRTGLGLTHRLVVTVVARTGLMADGLSTAVSVLGPEKGRALVRAFPGTAIYLQQGR